MGLLKPKSRRCNNKGSNNEELLKVQNKKLMNIVEKQGELLRQFKISDGFFEWVSVSRSNIYFKYFV